MGLRKDELFQALVLELNEVFGIDTEYTRLLRWLANNHPAIFRDFDSWQTLHKAPSNKHAIRTWLTQNHPELIPMIDLFEAAQCE